MKSYYLVANGQPNDRAIYYTGKEAFHGGQYWGNVNEAYRFETKEEVFKFLATESWCASPILVSMADVTLDICMKGYEDCINGIKSSEQSVYHRYNTVSYITNSKQE